MQLNTPVSPRRLSIPDEVESSTGKLVYVYLAMAGDASVSELASALDLGGLTVAGVLDALAEKSVVERDDGRYATAK